MGVIKYWNPETQTWDKAQAPSLTEDFYKKSEVDQKFEDLDAADVNAMPIIDARSADYDMNQILQSGEHYGIYRVNASTLGTPSKLGESSYSAGIIVSYAGSTSYGQQFAIIAGGICLFHRQLNNGVISAWSEVYSELNKPTAADIGAAPAIQYGTEPVTEGAASSYPDGTLYVVINE